MKDVEKILGFYPPEDVHHLARLNREMGGRDEDVVKELKILDSFGIGRAIVSKNPNNELERKIIGISLSVPKEITQENGPLHCVALEDASIFALRPDVPENKSRHIYLFGRYKEPLVGAWDSGEEFSNILEQDPGKYYSKVTHSIFEPNQRHEVKDIFLESMENAFILRENKIDGLQEGRTFLKELFAVFDPKKKY